MSVKGLHADLYNYSGRKDFQVYSTYVDKSHYSITVKRLDSKSEGWTENLKVLCWFKWADNSQIHQFGSSSTNEKSITYESQFELTETEQVLIYPSYDVLPVFQAQRISRSSFNRLFNADIVRLPKSLFAVGVKNGCVYMYNEGYEHLYMIELTLKNLIGVALQNRVLREFYFVISAYDGYLEGNYVAPRTKAHRYGENELAEKNNIELPTTESYPLLHSDLFVLAQSHQKTTPYAINVPDRYYFYMNRYNEYRSVHAGIAFKSKIPQIVYGSLPRGTKFNFTTHRDIQLSPREYFYSDAVSKENIVAPKWIERSDMIKYKYVLDIDGNTSTWDATAWKLNSGSVILKTDSCWTQWFYDKYKPWENYVPIADDFSDLQEKLQWCETHQEECEQMIERNLVLFQEVYRFNNVMEYLKSTIHQLSDLRPAFTDASGRNLYIFDINNSDKVPFKLNAITKYPPTALRKVSILHNLAKRANPDDIIMYVNTPLIDVINWDPTEFLESYSKVGADIVFGAERNLWPGTLETLRHKIEQVNSSTSSFKYLNASFFIGKASSLLRLLDERIYEGEGFIDQEYFTHAYITGKYSIALDVENKLVLNTYRCTHAEIAQIRQTGVPFVLWNGGRF